MIIGIGIDIIEVDRIRQKVLEDYKMQLGIFTEAEIKYCQSKMIVAEEFAGKFAAKEACLKAIGTGLVSGMSYADIEILNDTTGKPIIRVYNRVKDICDELGVVNLHVSISHLKDLATAVVVAETNHNRD